MKEYDANTQSGPLHPSSRNIKMCEAIDCYEGATEVIVVSVGKFGTIDLHLCHECAVTKFRTIPRQDTILKKKGYAGQKTPLNQPVGDHC